MDVLYFKKLKPTNFPNGAYLIILAGATPTNGILLLHEGHNGMAKPRPNHTSMSLRTSPATTWTSEKVFAGSLQQESL